jgi:hypothetical protein
VVCIGARACLDHQGIGYALMQPLATEKNWKKCFLHGRKFVHVVSRTYASKATATRGDNGDERKGAGHGALNKIYSNEYAQPNERISWRP